jgi:2-dehydro-3-deoxyphosphooctonate aldolase (KDO 8-P synthase)
MIFIIFSINLNLKKLQYIDRDSTNDTTINMKKPDSFIIIAGPCVAESREMLRETAAELINITKDLDVDLYFKASYRKANRSSANSFIGVGDEKALGWLKEIREEFGVPVLTDIHSESEAALAAEYVDVIQIPAFLCRQTELLAAAAKTGKPVNIKKGQFMAPEDMKKACEKVSSEGNDNIWLTERGTFFGYHDLVVDFRSLIIMQQFGYPVIYDATHSVQQPSIGEQSGGRPEFIFSLARAAAATGIDGIFFETHPDPKNAKSDAATQLPLDRAGEFVKQVLSCKF